MSAKFTVLLLASLLWGEGIAAQQELDRPELVPGARVRVEAEGRAAIGGIHSLPSDSIVITLWDRPGFWALPMASIRRIEISSGTESRLDSAIRWGWRSALIFGGLIAALGAPTCVGDSGGECDGFGDFIGQSAVSGAMMGALYGAFAPRERWITIPT